MGRFIASVSVVPVGTKTTSLSNYIAQAIKVLQKLGINFELTPMSTIMSCDNLDTLFLAIKEIHDELVKQGVSRLVISIDIDARHDKPRTSKDKVKSVMEKL